MNDENCCDLLGMYASEMRTPVNSIAGFSQLIQIEAQKDEGTDLQAIIHHAATIQRSAERLLILLDAMIMRRDPSYLPFDGSDKAEGEG